MVTMIFMAGCRNEPQGGLLTEAESFLPAEEDSADVRLNAVDAQQLQDAEEEAWYALVDDPSV